MRLSPGIETLGASGGRGAPVAKGKKNVLLADTLLYSDDGKRSPSRRLRTRLMTGESCPRPAAASTLPSGSRRQPSCPTGKATCTCRQSGPRAERRRPVKCNCPLINLPLPLADDINPESGLQVMAGVCGWRSTPTTWRGLSTLLGRGSLRTSAAFHGPPPQSSAAIAASSFSIAAPYGPPHDRACVAVKQRVPL